MTSRRPTRHRTEPCDACIVPAGTTTARDLLMTVYCPYCAVALKKPPLRKKKCPACKQDIYVKATPDDRTKRLMTASEAQAAETAWAKHGYEQEVQRDITTWGLNATDYFAALQANGGSRASTLNALLQPRADAGELSALVALINLARNDEEALDRTRTLYRHNLERLKDAESRGIVLGVRVRKPSAWKEAAPMLELSEQGYQVSEIALRTGQSVMTVSRTLQTRGEHPRCGPQCDELGTRVFTVDQALREMPIPCGAKCACWWRSVVAGWDDPI